MKTHPLQDLFANASYPVLVLEDKEEQWQNAAFDELPKQERQTALEWAQKQDYPSCLETERHTYELLIADERKLIVASTRHDRGAQRALCQKMIHALSAQHDPWLSSVQILGPMLQWSHTAAVKRKSDTQDELLGHWHKGALEPPQTIPFENTLASQLYDVIYDQMLVHRPADKFPEDKLVVAKKHSFWIGQRIDTADGETLGYLCAWGKPDADQIARARQVLSLAADIISGFIAHADNVSPSASIDIQHLAPDHLTGLPGRRAFDHTLETAEAAYLDRGQDCLMAMLDISGLSAINAERGVEAGDQLLRELASQLEALYSGADRVFRFGGDEFVILQPFDEIEPPLLQQVRDIESALQETFSLPVLRLCAGTARLSDSKGSSDDLMLLCDKRLQDAKAPR